MVPSSLFQEKEAAEVPKPQTDLQDNGKRILQEPEKGATFSGKDSGCYGEVGITVGQQCQELD